MKSYFVCFWGVVWASRLKFTLLIGNVFILLFPLEVWGLWFERFQQKFVVKVVVKKSIGRGAFVEGDYRSKI